MSDLSYDRCPHDDWKRGSAEIGKNPETGQPVTLDVNGVASVVAMQSAFMTISAAMKAGHEEDFLEKVALCLYGKIEGDPHALCPILTIASMILLMVTGQAGVVFDGDFVRIQPPKEDVDGGDTCMYDTDEETDDESDEETLGEDGAGPSGNGNGFSP